MKKATLIRLSDNGKQRLGELIIHDGLDRIFTCKTLEPAWRDNERNVSSIPTGIYKVARRFSNRFKNHYHVLDVKGRDLILIHSGNFRENTEGCILPGRSFADVNNDGILDITASKATLHSLLVLLGNEFILNVV